jgi:excisionase family DNA binding protein
LGILKGYSTACKTVYQVKKSLIMTTENTLFLTGAEVARELKISRALAYRWMARGVLPTVRIPGGRTVRVPREALLAWVHAQTQQATGAVA